MGHPAAKCAARPSRIPCAPRQPPMHEQRGRQRQEAGRQVSEWKWHVSTLCSQQRPRPPQDEVYKTPVPLQRARGLSLRLGLRKRKLRELTLSLPGQCEGMWQKPLNSCTHKKLTRMARERPTGRGQACQALDVSLGGNLSSSMGEEAAGTRLPSPLAACCIYRGLSKLSVQMQPQHSIQC